MKEITPIIISLLTLIFFLFYQARSDFVVFLNVGQGDSMLFQSGTTQVVVDGSGGDSLVQKLGKYIPILDRRIEYVVLTHMHLDHFGGLIALLQQYDVKNIVMPSQLCKDTDLTKFFLNELKEEGASILGSLELKIGDVRIRTISKNGRDCVSNQADINNSSIVTEIISESVRLLNVGDLEADGEKEYRFGGYQVLKAGHHCSETSSSKEFVYSVLPKFVVCSFGVDNSYGHPSKEVLDRLEEQEISVISTAYDGDILVNLVTGLIYNGKSKIIGRL